MIPLVFQPIYSQLQLSVKHRFPIQKYQGIRDKLVKYGVADSWFYQPDKVELDKLLGNFEPAYVQNLLNNERDEAYLDTMDCALHLAIK